MSESHPHKTRTSVYEVAINFGDCDPAGIVFFPNFSKWMDAASLNYFVQCGIPVWRELVKTHGIVGTPLLEINTKFIKTATYGETIHIDTTITEWRAKTFTQRHIVRRGETVLCEGTEVRAFCMKEPDNADRIRAMPVPEFIKAACALSE